MKKNRKAKPDALNSGDRKPAHETKRLHIYRDWCKCCGICAAFCPKGALQMEKERPEWKYPEKCIACRACEYRCPDFAIEMIQDGEAEDAS